MTQKNSLASESTVEVPAPSISVSDARRVIEDQNRKHIEACSKEIQATLQKYGCRFEVRMIISATSVVPVIDIIPAS